MVSDEDDEEEEAKAKRVAAPKTKKPAPTPKEEETTSSAYFASNPKPATSKSTPIRSKHAATTNGAASTPSKASNGATPSTGRRSARKASKKSYAEDEDGDTKALLDDDEAGNDDIFADNFKSRRANDDYKEDADDDNEVLRPSARPKANGTKKQKPESEDEDGDLEMSELPAFDGGSDAKRKRAAAHKTTSKKRKSEELDDEDEDDFVEDDDPPKKKSQKTAAKSASKKPRAAIKKEDKADSKEIQDIYDSIPTIRAPTPPPRDPESRKFTQQFGGNSSKEPTAAGSKSIPEGAPNCLAGLTFVFTGVLETLGRDEGQNLVKRYGGKITSAPSKKTSYVVLGQDAGPKKLETIRNLGIKSIDEDGLFELIRRVPAGGGDSKAAEEWAAKKAKEEERIKKQAEEIERQEMVQQEAAAKKRKQQPQGLEPRNHHSRLGLESRIVSWSTSTHPIL